MNYVLGFFENEITHFLHGISGSSFGTGRSKQLSIFSITMTVNYTEANLLYICLPK